MLIILEGVDGTGKSTLALRLVEAIETAFPGDRVELLASGPPRLHPLDEYETPLYDYRPGTGRHIICDRWHVGEAVYPRVLGRETYWDTAVHRHLELFMRSRGALLVYVEPPAEVSAHWFSERGDEMINAADRDELATIYREFMLGTHLTKLHVVDPGSPFTVENIVGQARRLDAQYAELNRFVTYVGPRHPAYLILGDVRHGLGSEIAHARRLGVAPNTMSTIPRGVAFGPYRATSGHYLLTNLPLTLWESRIGLANACDVDDITDLRSQLGYPPTVALGVNAWQALVASITSMEDGQIAAAPHPQYVRRFQNRHGWAYGQIIASAVKNGVNELGWRP